MCLKYFIDLCSYTDQKKKLATLKMELTAISEKGFISKHFMAENNTTIGKGLITVKGIVTVWL